MSRLQNLGAWVLAGAAVLSTSLVAGPAAARTVEVSDGRDVPASADLTSATYRDGEARVVGDRARPRPAAVRTGGRPGRGAGLRRRLPRDGLAPVGRHGRDASRAGHRRVPLAAGVRDLGDVVRA